MLILAKGAFLVLICIVKASEVLMGAKLWFMTMTLRCHAQGQKVKVKHLKCSRSPEKEFLGI